MDTVIGYILLRPDTGFQLSRYHWQDMFEVKHLPLFELLTLLPAAVEQVIPTGHPFADAVDRLQKMPQFRDFTGRLNDVGRQALQSCSVRVFLVSEKMPEWMIESAKVTPAVVVTPTPSTYELASSMPGLHPVLIRGISDLPMIYQSIAALLEELISKNLLPTMPANVKSRILSHNLFDNRPTLTCIPTVKLPEPDEGRSAAILLNRLSNNLEGIRLPDKAVSSPLLVTSFEPVKQMCVALGALEKGILPNTEIGISRSELETIHAALIGKEAGRDDLEGLLIEPGKRLVRFKPRSNYFVSLPTIKPSEAKRNVLSLFQRRSWKNEPTNRLNTIESIRVRAIKDFCNRTYSTDDNIPEREVYEGTHQILAVEQHLIASQTALLAGKLFATPVMTHTTISSFVNVINDFQQALNAESSKALGIFRSLQDKLIQRIPKQVVDDIFLRARRVIFYSDLPFEWASLDNEVLCLGKPVSRIPLTMTRWSTLCSAFENETLIDATHPERVLVLDAFDPGDQLKRFARGLHEGCLQKGIGVRYEEPRSKLAVNELLERYQPEIVVWEGHGSYHATQDKLYLQVGSKRHDIDELLEGRIVPVPKIWILSACETAMTGALRGCLARQLIARGAICVIATVARIDARIAKFFVEQLLRGIYLSKFRPDAARLDEVVRRAQLVVSVCYEPLLPLLWKAEKEPRLRRPLEIVLKESATLLPADVVACRRIAGENLKEGLKRQGLLTAFENTSDARCVGPQALMFSVFGNATRVRISG